MRKLTSRHTVTVENSGQRINSILTVKFYSDDVTLQTFYSASDLLLRVRENGELKIYNQNTEGSTTCRYGMAWLS